MSSVGKNVLVDLYNILLDQSVFRINNKRRLHGRIPMHA